MDDINWYMYVGGNPIGAIDPEGLFKIIRTSKYYPVGDEPINPEYREKYQWNYYTQVDDPTSNFTRNVMGYIPILGLLSK